MRKLVLLIVVLFPYFMGAQNGSICIELREKGDFVLLEKFKMMSIILEKEGSDVKSSKIISNEVTWCFDHLEAGIYSVKFVKSDFLGFTFSNLVLKENGQLVIPSHLIIQNLDLRIPQHQNRVEGKKKVENSNPEEILTAISFHHRFLSDKTNPIKFTLEISITNNRDFFPRPNQGFGFSTGISFLNAFMEKNTISFNNLAFTNQSYYAVNIALGPYSRTILKKRDDGSNLNMDIGLQYKLPAFFSWYGYQKNAIIRQFRFHEYTDFSGIFRLNWYQMVGFVFEYRLLDFLKGPFPELPKYKLGISFSSGKRSK